MRPEYQVAIVTGASTGIGSSVAQRLAKEGMRLVLLARRQELLSRLAETLSEHTPCHVLACDIRDRASLRSALDSLPVEFSEPDVLVNNAGLALGLEPAQRASWEDWQQMIETNCAGLASIAHLLLPGMVERNHGHIFNLGSVAGSYAYVGANVYGASKAFVEQFSRNLRADLVGTAIRVTNIEPGMVGDSEFSLVRFKGDLPRAAKVYEGAEALQPESIAECVAWALAQPAHVNISRIEVMPTCQAPSGLAVHRES